MNYLSLIKKQPELLIGFYILFLFVAHHTFSPSLFWFRDFTSNTFFRLGFLALIGYCLYCAYTKKVKLNSRLGRQLVLLVVAYLLTEYHSLQNLPWEFFENQENSTVFLKTSGKNLFLSAAGESSVLSEGAGDLSDKSWVMEHSGSDKFSLKLDGKYLTPELFLKTSDEAPLWTLEMVDESLISEDNQKKDKEQVLEIKGSDDKPCGDDGVKYVRLKTDDGYLTAQDGKLSLEKEISEDNAWVLYKCLHEEKKNEDNTPEEKVEEGYQNPIQENLRLKKLEEGAETGRVNKEMLGLFMPNLDSIINDLKGDTPTGKAYKDCSDDVCGRDPVVKLQSL